MNNTPEAKPQRSLSPEEIPYHNAQLLRRFSTDTGKILPRKYTRLSAKQQRSITSKVKRGRNIHLSA